MRPEHAALLAQVIPVAALAVGLEVRALARQVETARKNLHGDESVPSNNEAANEGVARLPLMMVVVLAAVQIGFVIAENEAIRIALEEDVEGRSFLQVMVRAGVFIAFIAPAYDSLIRVTYAYGWSVRGRPVYGVVAMAMVVFFAIVQALVSFT